jgi:MFS family permease
MDRSTLAGMIDHIRNDASFNVKSDKSLGLLQTAFVICYMIFAPIFGYLGDRFNRKWLITVGLTFWSLSTLIGSFMTNFWCFLLFRAFVGIGEASYSTVAPAIISDLFSKDARSNVLALFFFAIPVGTGLG